MKRRRSVWAWVGMGAAWASGMACGPPKAAPIEGDISKAIALAMAEGSRGFDHRLWDEILKAHGKNGGRQFDYAGLKQEEDQFDRYLESLATVDLTRLTADELEALFINAYNAYTVRTILDHVEDDGSYGIESIRDIPNVFGDARHVVGGFTLSLDNIEHNILRPVFKDPRVHFAVNCASASCPPLPLFAFDGASIDEQLDTATRAVLTDPDYVSVEDDRLVLTKILEWYGSDFTNPDFDGSEASLPLYLRKYADTPVREFIDSRTSEGGGNKDGEVAVRFRDYAWDLNRPT